MLMSDNDPTRDDAELDPSKSVLDGLGQATWSDEDAFSYEAAVDSINNLIGTYSGLIGNEEDTDAPDSAKIAAWRAARQDWADRRRALTPDDTAAVQAVRREVAVARGELERP